MRLMQRHPGKRLNAKQIIKKLKINNSKEAVNDALSKLSEKGQLRAIGGGKFQIDRAATNEHKSFGKASEHIGKVDMTRSGSAYIICEDVEDDIFVNAKRLNGALHGDKVKVSVFKSGGQFRRKEGSIIKVLERATESFIGTLRLTRKYGLVIPDRTNMPYDIFVAFEDIKEEAQDGDKVVVKVVDWPTRHNQSPIGVITTVLGQAGTSDIEMKSILINNGFDLEFSEEVLAESESLSDTITEADLAERRDMREITTFTIDPVDAKDFDDALSYQELENGDIEIGVHIADVTHYLHPGTALDKEAYERSTSVYLVDRVLPMLPERLSNGLCSLRPNEDKFTFSAVFTFGKGGKLKDRWFGKTLTHSNRRYAYEEAQEVIENGKGDFAEELQQLNKIALKLRKDRFKNGAIAFESEEVRFKLDEDGTPIDVFVKERKDAHLLIEDFMLLANKEVAYFMAKKEKPEVPFVYRVHDLPDPDKVADFARFAHELGVNIRTDTPEQIAKSFNDLAKKARENDAVKMLEPMAIRTMAKAIYTSDNIGHYGLGFEYYSHFTSPIRRYSDVLAHRILYENLSSIKRFDKERLELQCKHISAQERKAMDAERESVKYKQVEYVMNHEGKIFDGFVSGFLDRGFFVELAHSKAEGLIGFDRLDEPYDIDAGRLKAVGRQSGDIIRMGQAVRVQIIGTDLSRREIEMDLV